MNSAELEKRLGACAGRDAAGAPADEAELRAVCEELARQGAPPGCEVTAQRLVFGQLEWIQDHLPAELALRLEQLLEEPGQVPRRAPESLDRRVMDAVRKEAPQPLPPPPPPAIIRWSLGIPMVVATGLVILTTLASRPITAPVPDPPAAIAGPGAIEVRIDRKPPAFYRQGESVFVQLAATGSGHLALIAVTASGRVGLLVGEQPVRAGQVVMARATVGDAEGRALLVGVVASRPLGELPSLLPRIPRPVDDSKIIEAIRGLAARRDANVVFGTATIEIRAAGR